MDGQATVLQNRVSWRKYDRLRQTSGLTSTSDTPTRKRASTATMDDTPPAKKKHGCKVDSLQLDREKLLSEATEWSENDNINWSAKASEYGLSGANRGQTLKEYLQQEGIELALKKQRKSRAPRRQKKRVPGTSVCMPMPPPAKVERKKLQQRILNGEFTIREEVVEQESTQMSITPDSDIVQTTTTFLARKAPLLKIRKSILTKHEKLGLLRATEDFSSLTLEQIELRLSLLGEHNDKDLTENELREKIIMLSRKRYLKLWHDHSTVAGHTYFLILVTPIYDEAFYYTAEEMEQRTGFRMNVQTLVERPEIHIIGRSGASITDQMQFNQCRQDCMRATSQPIETESKIAISDVIRFFHGDGPAQQYEGGHKQGGIYRCVGCGGKTELFDDFAYCHHAEKRSYRDCQEFVTRGLAWKKRGRIIKNPYSVTIPKNVNSLL